MVVECSIRELVQDRLPEAIRRDFFKSIFLGAVVVVLQEQVALRIMLFMELCGVLLTAGADSNGRHMGDSYKISVPF